MSFTVRERDIAISAGLKASVTRQIMYSALTPNGAQSTGFGVFQMCPGSFSRIPDVTRVLSAYSRCAQGTFREFRCAHSTFRVFQMCPEWALLFAYFIIMCPEYFRVPQVCFCAKSPTLFYHIFSAS